RLWVAEMRGYMPDVDGTNEAAPIGKVVVLEDLDGDGRMDRSTPFLEELVLPRAISFVPGGVLLLAPPDLLYCEDLDGDLRSDRETVVSTGWGGVQSPEHGPNAMVRGLDNRIHFAKHGEEAAWINGTFKTWSVPSQGQWGLTQDDWGRLFFNNNSTLLQTDLVPRFYGRRNPGYKNLKGLGVRVLGSNAVWPSRVTPGVNRGYQPATLREDGTLKNATGTCGPGVMRGTAVGPAKGSILIPEPCGNLVKMATLEIADGTVRGQNAYPSGQEFWTSTDERFRPVNVFDGPDGATYVVDLYRGILQHRMFVTSYLRKQILERELDTPLGLGRIWRVRAIDTQATAPQDWPEFEDAPTSEWVAGLRHPDGFWRDTIQRMLVDRGDPSVNPVLRAFVKQARLPESLHAVWALQALGGLDESTARAFIERVPLEGVPQAIRVAESHVAAGSTELLEGIRSRCEEGDLFTARQAVLTALTSPSEKGRALVWDLFFAHANDAVLVSSLATAPPKRIAGLLADLLRDPRFDDEVSAHRLAHDTLVASSQGRLEVASQSPVYRRSCAACHGADGLGQPGLAPPLDDLVWLEKPSEELIRIVLDGLEGKIQVHEAEWNLAMPGWRQVLSDAEIAEALTDIQKRFAENPRTFTVDQVSRVRNQLPKRTQ
ncbi:MAG: c-type cytochrome, partial [Planctomycetes bacterium]|nr:c-type cytochrome [Planctomycetota bacterium]